MGYREWEEFFERLENIARLPAMSWAEKRKMVVDAAILHDATATLDEFLGWFGGSIEP